MNVSEQKKIMTRLVSSLGDKYNKHSEFICRIFFGNGLGVSLIRRAGISYGWEKGLFEILVVEGDAQKSQPFYGSPVTDDILGWLTPAEVVDAVCAVASLSGKETGLDEPPTEDESETVDGLASFFMNFYALLIK